MPVTGRSRRAAIAMCVLAALIAGAGRAAWAGPHAGVDAQLYRPSVDAGGVFSLDGGDTMERHDLSTKLGVGYGLAPFRVAVPGIGDDDGADTVLGFALSLHMTLGFALTDRLTIALDTGLYRADTDAGYGTRGRYRESGSEPSTGLISLRPLTNIDPSGGFEAHGLSGPLDARVGLKFQLIDGRAINASILALASLPFGEDEMFLGDRGFVLSPRLAVDVSLGAATLVANVGASFRRRTVLQAYDPAMQTPDDALAVLDVGSEITAGLGVTYRLGARVTAGAEGVLFAPLPASMSYGSCRLDDGRRCSALDDSMYFAGAGYGDPAGYAMAGIRLRAGRETAITTALGAGLAGARRERARVVMNVTWTPLPYGMHEVGSGDRDGDGNPDVTDVCPDEPEDADDFQDADGCPEADNDGDGLLDATDACPDEPEDKDGHLDDDGCPELDNDSDSIPDATDRCIGQPEDIDGFEDDDGCPDLDNDGDDIPDDSDRCPNAAETRNGIDDDDGCPDEDTQTGPVEAIDRIDLRGNRIAFASARSARLTEASQRVLSQVADIIKAGNLRIRIEVHVPLSTRSQRRRALARASKQDRRLAQRRADAVLRYLHERAGVPLPALQAVGIGSARPREQPATSALNERVDFIKREQRQR